MSEQLLDRPPEMHQPEADAQAEDEALVQQQFAEITGGLALGQTLEVSTLEDETPPQATIEQNTEAKATARVDKQIEEEGLEAIPVEDAYGGRVFAATKRMIDRHDIERYDTQPKRDLMSRLGLQFQVGKDGKVTKVFFPDTERLDSAIKTHNMPIKLEANNDGRDANGNPNGRISLEAYSADIDEEGHPVGTDNLGYYGHDLKDHAPAVAVCGPELFDIFKTALKPYKGKATGYDLFTGSVTQAVWALLDGNTSQFDKLIDTTCASKLNGFDQDGKAIDNGVGQKLRAAIFGGLDRLDIAYARPDSSQEESAPVAA